MNMVLTYSPIPIILMRRSKRNHHIFPNVQVLNKLAKLLIMGANMAKRTHANPEDRRTRYTRMVIKQALLELVRNKPFEKITVTEICKVSDINRGTFYLHYYDALDVLDDLIQELFSDTTDVIDHVLCPHREVCSYPLCEKIQANPTYHPLFLDEAASARILHKIAEEGKERFVTYLMQNSSLLFEQAEAIFYFQIHGCMTVNRMMLKNHCTDWRSIQSVIDQVIKSGLEALLRP